MEAGEDALAGDDYSCDTRLHWQRASPPILCTFVIRISGFSWGGGRSNLHFKGPRNYGNLIPMRWTPGMGA